MQIATATKRSRVASAAAAVEIGFHDSSLRIGREIYRSDTGKVPLAVPVVVCPVDSNTEQFLAEPAGHRRRIESVQSVVSGPVGDVGRSAEVQVRGTQFICTD